MKSYPTLRRWLSISISLAVLTTVVGIAAVSNQGEKNAAPKVDKNYPWPLFGGTVQRNLVNLVDRNITIDFDLDPDGDFEVQQGKTKNVAWLADLGSRAYGGPVVSEGKIFIGTNNEQPRDPKIKGDKGVIMCFSETDGRFLWQNTYDKLPSGRVNDWPREGICSTPVVENGRLYYVSNRCEVVCANTDDGKHVWTLDMMGDLRVFPHNLATCSPLIVGDRLFVCTSNGVDKDHINIPAPKAPSFIAVDKRDGKLIWQDNSPSINLLKLPKGGDTTAFIKKLVNSGKLLMHGQWANPAYTEVNGVAQVIFPCGDGWLRAFNPADGELIWKFDCNPKDSVYELGARGTRNDFVNTPVVHDNKLYIGVGQDPEHDEGIGHFWCVDLIKANQFAKLNKDRDVSPKNDNFDPKDPINKNSALAWHYGGVGDAKTRIPGSAFVFGRTLSTACVIDGLVYIAELAGYVHCLDAKTGERYWYDNIRAPIWSSPYYCDGKIFMGTDDQFLYVYKHGKEKEVLAEIDMFGKIRATPIVANGVLYVMTENRLYAIKKQ